ncbi:hypothetical protein BJY24_005958 [Nocardia transvalensis]|uniref:Uncharacterized protein n=1 Tax=Nocardia transvalensis TaxID=37333 RepID=A0A7W9PJ98_9NOCA|nr:hypothetical protein [Nocardia transvalensis]MBB5917046.1 hypothetical protein [Nocardia transvalensis]
MTNPPSITARAVLFGHAAREVVENELAERLAESGIEDLALRHARAVTPIVRSAALREIAGAVDGLLAVDIGGVAVAGWRRYERLRASAARTGAGGTERVELIEHEITQTCRPRLEITLDGDRVGEFELELGGAVMIRPLTATVRDGMLVALGPGDCTVTISIRVPELGPILERERVFPVGLMVDLRRPIPILGHRPPPAASPPDQFGRPTS